MEVTADSTDITPSTYNRYQELREFDETKSGVKGLSDSGLAKIPRIFVRPAEEIARDRSKSGATELQIPVIDLNNLATNWPGAVEQVLEAAREVGFFQVVNHGVPDSILEGAFGAARAFHELPKEVKAEYYDREGKRRVNFWCNFDLYKSTYAQWRDTLFCLMEPKPLDPEDLPPVCRDAIMEYSKQVKAVGTTLLELLSEALGLKPDYLGNMDCAKGHALLYHYYPACPEPDLTMGTANHSDPDFLTILLQDDIGGLQVYYQDQWVDVPPVAGALVVNIGDLLQLMSNDVFKSVEHRVLSKDVGPRLSIACFFTLYEDPASKMYGPIKELVLEDRPALYREITLGEFMTHYYSKGLDGISALAPFRLPS
ncbi:1-aminocyclopropane-1-carboxylate oxidase homolog 3-like [Syzygium oleosum]|uniref:1-aminocyclopropane-1-carboxylate oxidase homolog 3-like n=1 Tax=Syzygium oleosum TaxID=219896 RepID=UPI0011D1EA14|nr:1-aminocyclopropane-1-carboxylate oxidase homolog 3-like [Syzygium oleosum]